MHDILVAMIPYPRTEIGVSQEYTFFKRVCHVKGYDLLGGRMGRETVASRKNLMAYSPRSAGLRWRKKAGNLQKDSYKDYSPVTPRQARPSKRDAFQHLQGGEPCPPAGPGGGAARRAGGACRRPHLLHAAVLLGLEARRGRRGTRAAAAPLDEPRVDNRSF